MIVNIAWLVERSDVQMLCSTPEKVDRIVSAILADDTDLIHQDTKLYQHILDRLYDISSPKESYVQLEYIDCTASTPESIKITRLQLL